MNIKKYTSYFHDGGIIAIRQMGNDIEISMDSSQLWPEWNEDNIPLSDEETIKGKLHLKDIESIIINDEPRPILKMLYDTGTILRLKIYDNDTLKLLVVWDNFPPKEEGHITELIEIKFKEIYWENIPDLFDPWNYTPSKGVYEDIK